jgi:BASS family bile acid:Na+ symporter
MDIHTGKGPRFGHKASSLTRNEEKLHPPLAVEPARRACYTSHGAFDPRSRNRRAAAPIGNRTNLWRITGISTMAISLDTIGTLLLQTCIVVIMFAIGLQVTSRELAAALRRRRLLAAALLANIVVLPLLAAALARLVAMPAEVAAGFIIVSVAPGAALGPKLSEIARADLPFSIGLLFILAVLSIVTTPLTAGLLLSDSPNLQFDPASVLVLLARNQLIPLLAGLAVHRWLPGTAARLRRPAILLGNVLYFAIVVFYFIRDFTAFRQLPLASVAAMVAMTLLSLAVGWLLGGPDRATRQALALGTSVEFTGLALLIVTLSFPDTLAGVAVVAFGLIMIVINTGAALFWNQRRPAPTPENAVGSDPRPAGGRTSR